MTPPTSQPGAPPSTDEALRAAGPPRRRSNVSVFIPTFNEEVNLPHALRSCVGWADAVFVVDSESTDRTREIATSMGAKPVIRPWLGYAKQKNWALDHLPFETDWVFILDADEAITPELRDEILAIAARPVGGVAESGFYVNRLTYFMGKPIRHCGYFPSYNLRLFKRGRARYEEREVHEHMKVDGPTARLEHVMLHDDRRGLEHFIAKHNRYSTLEARELTRERLLQREDVGPLERGIAVRRWLKRNVLPRLPLSGFWRFFYMYVLRLGFLDGANGFRFSLLLSTYDFFITLKLAELRSIGADRNPALLQTPAARGLAVAEGEAGPIAPAAAEAPAAALNGAATPAAPPTGRAAPAEAPPEPAAVPAAARRIVPADGRGASAAPAWDPRSNRCFVASDAPHAPSPPISVVILTFNEESNIAACLESCAWCDDVHVLDSGSTDRTREIAERMGVTVHVNPFRSFGQQRNWAIDHIPTRHRWQFHLDADERFTPASLVELGEVVPAEGPGSCTAYRCPSMMMFMDQWLRHAAEYPVYQVRLFDKLRCRFEDHGHGQREVTDGPIGTLREPYLHYNFSKGLLEWFDKHNRYSSLEARQALDAPAVGFGQALRNILGRDSVKRRRTLKTLSYKVPSRSLLIFLYTVILRRGFLDGRAGVNYARMRSLYEGMIATKLAVFRHKKLRGEDPSRDTA
ncbi:MAG: glycosyltransferase family 2 protein [Phycisphaerales bacterium]|nr:glycosyltransferase family 2 protein [Phycisphaerales bacterium]